MSITTLILFLIAVQAVTHLIVSNTVRKRLAENDRRLCDLEQDAWYLVPMRYGRILEAVPTQKILMDLVNELGYDIGFMDHSGQRVPFVLRGDSDE